MGPSHTYETYSTGTMDAPQRLSSSFLPNIQSLQALKSYGAKSHPSLTPLFTGKKLVPHSQS